MKNLNRENIKKSVLNMVSDALDKADDQYDRVSDKTTNMISEIKEKATDIYDGVRSKTEYAKDKTEDYIKENPEKSVMIAAGVGALVGLILSGILKKNKK